MTQKPYHPGWTLIDKSAEELSALEQAGEISDKDVLGAKWRRSVLHTHTGDAEIKRYWQMKKAAEAETQTQ